VLRFLIIPTLEACSGLYPTKLTSLRPWFPLGHMSSFSQSGGCGNHTFLPLFRLIWPYDVTLLRRCSLKIMNVLLYATVGPRSYGLYMAHTSCSTGSRTLLLLQQHWYLVYCWYHTSTMIF